MRHAALSCYSSTILRRRRRVDSFIYFGSACACDWLRQKYRSSRPTDCRAQATSSCCSRGLVGRRLYRLHGHGHGLVAFFDDFFLSPTLSSLNPLTSHHLFATDGIFASSWRGGRGSIWSFGIAIISTSRCPRLSKLPHPHPPKDRHSNI